MAAFNVPRIHSETVWLLFFAAASTAVNSSGVIRTRSMMALASPLGNGGLPRLLGFFDGFGLGIGS